MNPGSDITTPVSADPLALAESLAGDAAEGRVMLLAQHEEEHHEEAAPADAHAEESHDAPAAEAHAEDAHAAEGHDAHDAYAVPAKYELPEEIPNVYSLFTKMVGGGHHGHHGADDSPFKGPFAVHPPFYQNPAFAFIYAAVFVMIVRKILRRAKIEKPGRAQVALELVMGGLFDFFGGILGGEKEARKYVPYVGSLWLFIFINCILGVIPGLKATTAHFWTVAGLGFCTFLYVNYHGIKAGGLGHYLWHLCGSPKSLIEWAFAPLIFPLEVMGTLVKPVSLSLRLSGNIFGEDKLLAAFIGLGMTITAFIFNTPTPLFGLPLHLPFLFLSVLTSLIQATVFTLLTSVYIALMLPHEHHDHEEGHGHGDAHGHGHEKHAH